MGTPRQPPCVPWPVQLRHECSLSGEEYVARKAWCDASLASCPCHPAGGCGFVRHGSYPRRTPTGMRVARYYCPTAHETFSLLPDCLASHFPGTLAAIEDIVVAVEGHRSVEAAADALRPDITLASAVRWLRRRTTAVRLVLLTLATLLPDRFPVDVHVGTWRATVGRPVVLPALRAEVPSHLRMLPTPLGFRPPHARRAGRRRGSPHGMGADRAGPRR